MRIRYLPDTPRRRLPLAAAVLALLIAATTSLAGAPAYADANRDKQWHLSVLGVPAAHQQAQGDGVTVAVVDTGVDANHPDLIGNVLPGIDSYNTALPGTTDTVGHGTGMASIVAGHGHGVGNADGLLGIAPKAKVLPIRVATAAGRGTQIDPRAVGLGIMYAANRGADVILVSISGNSAPELAEGIAAAKRKGALVIAAAGNTADGPNVVGFPARMDGVIGVSSVDQRGGFSTTSVSGDGIDIAAPGVDIMQAMPNGGYAAATGTSSAAAIVAGATALLVSRYPDASRDDIAARLLWRATDKGTPGFDAQYGWGTLDLAKSLTGPVPEMPSAAPSGADATTPAVAVPRSREDDGFYLDWSRFGPLCVLPTTLIVLGIVLLIVVLRRRKAAAAAAATSGTQSEAPSATVDAADPPPPAAPEAQADEPDDTVWQRPPPEKDPPS